MSWEPSSSRSSKLREALGGLSLPRLRWQRPDADLTPAPRGRRVLRLYLLKPSRYDDDGRVMQFRWGVIPANTLSVLAGLARAWDGTQTAVDLQLVIWDELVDTLLDALTIASIVHAAEQDRVDLLIGLVGVQTNQYPRARDIALQFRRHTAAVVAGGFHVSSDAVSRAFLESAGVTTVRGEAETTLPRLFDDFLAGEMRPSYSVENGIRARTGLGSITVPELTEAPLPTIERRYLERFFNPRFSTIDTSRGCPFVCSYCSVKNVMGRTVRARDPRGVVEWVRQAHDRHGVQSFLFVDDDLFRSPLWESLFAGLADLRRRGRSLSFFMQTDVDAVPDLEATVSADSSATRRRHRFVKMAAEAGCYQVFMGFESLEPANLTAVRKHQNQAKEDRLGAGGLPGDTERLLERYRRVVATWHTAGIGVHCGYMIGLPGDRAGCGARAARQLAAIGVDIASFFAATPLPDTEDYDDALAQGALRESDWNAYDTTHFVRHHDHLSREQLECEYADAYRTFYAARRLAWSLATLHRVPGLRWPARLGMLAQQVYYTYATWRGWHPMLGGIGRRYNGEHRQAIHDAEARAIYLDRAVVGHFESRRY